jgi:acylphosphatase
MGGERRNGVGQGQGWNGPECVDILEFAVAGSVFGRLRSMSDRESKSAQRREVNYSGHVQGVGFRYSVRQLASGFEVRGFVRNLPDGRVQLVAEGLASELTRFLDEIAARMAAHIRDVKVDVRPATGEFTEFAIRY